MENQENIDIVKIETHKTQEDENSEEEHNDYFKG